MSAIIYFAVGRCQHGKGGCQAAAAFDQRSKIVSPDFASAKALDAWLAEKAKDPAGRRLPIVPTADRNQAL